MTRTEQDPQPEETKPLRCGTANSRQLLTSWFSFLGHRSFVAAQKPCVKGQGNNSADSPAKDRGKNAGVDKNSPVVCARCQRSRVDTDSGDDQSNGNTQKYEQAVAWRASQMCFSALAQVSFFGACRWSFTPWSACRKLSHFADFTGFSRRLVCRWGFAHGVRLSFLGCFGTSCAWELVGSQTNSHAMFCLTLSITSAKSDRSPLAVTFPDATRLCQVFCPATS